MVVYIVVFVVFVLILFGAYRSLGMPAASVASPRRVLIAIQRELRACVLAMRDATENPAAPAKEGRRTAAGASQQIAQMEEDDPDLRAAADLLGGAAESCAWAGRLMESDAYTGNPGLQDAAALLLEHAQRCLDAVVLEAVAEPGAPVVAQPAPPR